MTAWVLATEPALLAPMVRLARAAGDVTVLAVGPRAVADAAAAAGPVAVLWVDPGERPVEAFAPAVGELAAAQAPDLLLAAGSAAARALLGAAAVRRGAALVGGVVGVTREGSGLVVERRALDGAVLETLTAAGPLAAVVAVDDDAPAPGVVPAPVTATDLGAAADVVVVGRAPVGGGSGVGDADRVVSVGRGLRSKADLELVGTLTAALGAELACSMPVADDLGWVPKERYVGRSGQHIAPRLYLALGISGAPQHMEGVRDAGVVVAVNADPDAPIFRTADLGVVGDLYEVVPALVAALTA